MSRVVIGVFILLHGLVHLWYFTLSRGLVEFQPEMGWTGRSWLFTDLWGDAPTRALASLLHVVAAVGFAAASIGILGQQAWWRPVTMLAAIFSTIVIILFWDGNMQMPVQKGLLGVLINIVILGALLLT